jgi:ABC-type uncharacterized transport system auxiliary subunit
MLLGVAGCLGGTRPAPLVKHYVLEYPAPKAVVAPAREEALRVSRFSAERIYAGPEMIVRRGPYQREAYHGQRWRVSPADLVTDALRQDLRSAGLFRAVLTARDREEARFALEGGVETFLEQDSGTERKAALALTITLLDLSQRDMPKRLLLHKSYRAEVPCRREGAEGLAEAMSAALAQCSAQIGADVAAALKR